MKSNKNHFTAFTVVLLTLLLCVFSMTVFAENDNLDDFSTLIDDAPAPVSGCDLMKYDLNLVTVKTTNFKMLVPKGNPDSKAEYITIESPKDVIASSSLAQLGYTRSALISNNIFFYFNTNTDNYCQGYAAMMELGPLDSYFGDYAKLTKEQQDELISEQLDANDTASKGSFEKINGRTYLLISKPENDESTGNKYVSYSLSTVIGSYKYVIQVDALNPTDDDLQVINKMLNSIKLDGVKAPLSTLDIVLIVCGVILLLAVAFAVFTIYRLGEYMKAGLVPASVFGFDVPDNTAAEDDSDDDDDDSEDDDGEDDALEDDAEEESDDSVSAVSLDKDESILG